MSATFDRRSFLARGVATGAGLAVAGGIGGLLEACGSPTNGSGSGSASRSSRNGVSTATPKRGGQIVFGNEAEDDSMDPASAQWDESGINYARSVYDPLTIIGADGTVKPYLAESVTANPDYTQWTITARPGVVFHDGSVCDGPAIANSMNHYLGGLLGTITRGSIHSIEASDAGSVVVSMSQPWSSFDYYLAGGVGGQIGYVVAPSVIAQAKANSQAMVRPVGTGPFVYADWVPNDHFTATRNPHYWRPGLPYLDQVTYRPIVDSDSRVSSLQAGTIDMMHDSAPTSVLAFRDDPAYGYVDDLHQTVGEPDMGCLLLNLSRPPFDDIRARQALAYALDQQTFRRVIDKDVGPASTQPFVPGTVFYAPVDYPSYDPVTAKTLVARYKSDKGPLSFTLGTVAGSSIAIQAAEFLLQSFTTAGMQCTIQLVQQDEVISDALAGKFEALAWRQFGAVDPDLNYIFWSPTTIYPSLGEAADMTRNTDARVQTALIRGRTAGSLAERAQAYQEVAKLFAADLPYIWTGRAVWCVVARGNVQNFSNPSAPGGSQAYGMFVGTIFPTQIWLS
jgi:ABC-type transport system substrate-binding protein